MDLRRYGRKESATRRFTLTRLRDVVKCGRLHEANINQLYLGPAVTAAGSCSFHPVKELLLKCASNVGLGDKGGIRASLPLLVCSYPPSKVGLGARLNGFLF